MEATSSTEGAPREDPAHVEASNGGGVPTNYRDESDNTSDVEGGMVATNGNRERMQEEVEEVLGVMLPPRGGLPNGFPAVLTASTDASDPIGTRRQGIQRMFQPAPKGTHHTIRPWGVKGESRGFRTQILFRGCSRWLLQGCVRRGTSYADSWPRPEPLPQQL